MESWREHGPRGVYGVLFNCVDAAGMLGDAVHAPPYVAPPRAPVLYIKPANTWSRSGAVIRLPGGETQVETGATLGIVMRRPAVRVSESRALDFVAGLTVVNDWSLSHASFYRPAIRERCRDGFCSLADGLVEASRLADLSRIKIRTYINGVLRHESCTSQLVRSVSQLVADVSEFMTLATGEVLLVGVAAGPPRAGEGDVVTVEAEGVGRVENTVASADAKPADAWHTGWVFP